MILKRDLIRAISELNHDVVALSIRVHTLERKVNSSDLALVNPKNVESSKKKVGRPRKHPKAENSKSIKKK